MISGRGSNLAAILELRDEVEIRVVVSSSPKAQGLARARRSGVQTRLAPQLAGTKKIDWAAITNELRALGVTHIFLAGFMKIVPPEFVADWRGRLVNLHPSLLPSYPGLQSIERAHAEKADIGVTVHEVDEDVDSGRVILQRRTLDSREVCQMELGLAEFLVHVDEQRLVKECLMRWAQ